MAYLDRHRLLLQVLVSVLLLSCIVQCSYSPETTANYLRHYFGKCLEFDAAREIFIFTSICREKFHFSAGAKFLHMPTKKCLFVSSTSDGSYISLSNQCNATGNLFQYDERNKVIIHLMSGKCLCPEGNSDDPSDNTPVVIKPGCEKNANKYYFRPNAYYIIRHFSGYCWVYVASEDAIKLRSSMPCDRFYYENNYHLKHANTGKCVTYHSSSPYYLKLQDDCTSATTIFKQNAFSGIQLSSPSYCVHPKSGILKPPSDDNLVRYPSCGDEDKIKFYFYDERDILKVKLKSDSCDDVGGVCSNSRGDIVVNGYQLSPQSLGINAVVYDYQSGLHETSVGYAVYDSSAARTNLADFLNGLTSGKTLFMAARSAVKFDSSSAEALQRYGVSATFATTSLPKARCSMVALASTDTERKDWEGAVNKVGGTGASEIETTIFIFRDLNGRDDCSQEMGIQTRKIPDSAFSATSVWENHLNHMAHAARLYKYGPGWCSASYTPLSHYLQIDLGTVKSLTGIAIQSHGTHNSHHIKTFSLEYSEDLISWQYYSESGNSKQIFEGVRVSRMSELRVNWFRRTFLRALRLRTESRVTMHGTHCVRVELYGCSSTSPVFVQETNPDLKILDKQERSIKLYHTIAMTSKAVFEISTAANINSLADNINQLEFLSINGSIVYDDGTKGEGKGSIVKSQESRIDSTAKMEFDIAEENYYAFDIKSYAQVLDGKQATGNVFTVVSYEAADQITMLAQSTRFQRLDNDRSVIQFNITDLEGREFMKGENIQINISIAHWLNGEDGSHSNAYDIDIFVYFDNGFIEFQEMKFIGKDEFSLAPTTNSTKQGLIHIHTKTLWMLNNQAYNLNFKMNNPQKVLKGDKCEGAFIIDHTYKTNLAKFNGLVNNTMGELIRYKCKIDQWKDIALTTGRLALPQFTMTYDDVNGDFFFCHIRKAHSTRDGPFCFRQQKDSKAWLGISNVAAVVGIDVARQALYGIHQRGKVYIRASHPFQDIYQIEDSEWIGQESSAATRKSISAADVTTLPANATEPFTLYANGNAIWALTKFGIQKKLEGKWERVVTF